MSDATANTPAEKTPTAGPASTAPAAAVVAAPAPAPAPPPPPVELKFTSKPMKIGLVPFLNAQPLAWQLRKHHQVIEVPPVQMGQLLKEGRLDVALAPIAAYLLNPGLTIIPI